MKTNAQYQIAMEHRKRAYVHAYRSERGCMDCGERDPRVLELDHRDPATKNPKMKKRGRSGWRALSWSAIDAELAKCDVVCANCHRKRTYERGGW